MNRNKIIIFHCLGLLLALLISYFAIPQLANFAYEKLFLTESNLAIVEKSISNQGLRLFIYQLFYIIFCSSLLSLFNLNFKQKVQFGLSSIFILLLSVFFANLIIPILGNFKIDDAIKNVVQLDTFFQIQLTCAILIHTLVLPSVLTAFKIYSFPPVTKDFSLFFFFIWIITIFITPSVDLISKFFIGIPLILIWVIGGLFSKFFKKGEIIKTDVNRLYYLTCCFTFIILLTLK